MIELRTLGQLEILRRGRDTVPVAVTGPKLAALLVYLAVAPLRSDFVRRDSLLALFWPDEDDAHARGALNQLLYRLRQTLGGDALLSRGSEEVGLDRSLVWCDAGELLEAIQRKDPDAVLALYRGPFLDGFHLKGSATFDRWMDETRHALRKGTAGAVWEGAERAQAEGREEEGGRLAREAFRLHGETDEATARSVMTLLWGIGDRAGALRVYSRLTEALESELELEPTAETVALVEAIRGDGTGLDPPPTAPPAPVSASGEGSRQEHSSTKASTVPPRAAPTGRRKRSRAAGVTVFGAAGLALLAAAATLLLGDPSSETTPNSEAPALVPERILVDLFENRTGDPELDHLGPLATDHITGGLTYASFADVITRGAPLLSRTVDPIAPDADPFVAARALGAGTLVRGSFALQGDSLYFSTLLLNVGDGRPLGEVMSVSAPRSNPIPALETLRDGVMAAIGARVDPRLARWSRHASKPPTFEAYRIFVEGLEAHTTAQDMAHARDLFLKAYQADTTFTMAALWAALAADNIGHGALADSILTAVGARKGTLPAVDRHFLEYLQALADESWPMTAPAALEALRRLIETAPGSDYLKNALQLAVNLQRPYEGLGYARMATPESGWLRGWYWFWHHWVAALDETDQCEEIPAVAQRARKSLPFERGQLSGGILELYGYACLGDIEGLLASARTFVRDAHHYGWTGGSGPAHRLGQAAGELLSHAPQVDPTPYLDFVKPILVERLDIDPFAPRWLGEILAATGQYDSARMVLEEALHSRELRPHYQVPVLLAALDVREGRHDRVEALLADAEELGPYPTDLRIGRAAVQAHAGDLEAAMETLGALGLSLGAPSRALMHRSPFLLGPLRDHPPYRELMAPRG